MPAGGVVRQIVQPQRMAVAKRLIHQFPAALPDHAVLGGEDDVVVLRLDRQRAAFAVRHFHQFQQIGIAQMRFRQARNVGDPDAGFVEGVEVGTIRVSAQTGRQRHTVQAGGRRQPGEFEQRGREID